MNNTITLTNGGGYMASGPEAVDLFRIKCVKQAIKAGMIGMKLTRGMTLTKSLKLATEYTGVKYKRTEAEKAIADLDALADGRVADGTVKVVQA